jgi:DNA mismatch endonuclease (patch repair protein)
MRRPFPTAYLGHAVVARSAVYAGRMESWATSKHARAVMQGNRRRDTTPELAIRRILHQRGARYRVDALVIPGLRRRADIVFTRRRVAVFVDGCFWHGCPDHFVPSKSNAEYWSEKIARNRTRDMETDQLLLAAGWRVHRHWSHEDPTAVAAAVLSTLGLGN